MRDIEDVSELEGFEEFVMQDELVKYNILAANRGSEYCMKPILPREGYKFISSDLCAGEPSLILNYTSDSFLYSILRGKGEAYIDNSGYFNSRNLYISTLSKSALYKDIMNKDFINIWNKDDEQAKQKIKKVYKLSKIAVLSILYGAGIGNPHKNTGLYNLFKLNNAGIDFPTTKGIWYDFWGSIPDVAKFRDESVAYFTACKKKNKPAMNAFGFIIPSSEPHKAFNYIIQSSLSSWVRELLKRMNLMGILGPQGALSTLVCVVHDEIIVEVREEDVELYRKRFFEAVDATNNHFGLKYPMELGFNVGSNFYEIH